MNTEELFEGVGTSTESNVNLADQVVVGETPEVAPIEVRTDDNTVTGGTDKTTGARPAHVEEDIAMDGIAEFDYHGAIDYLKQTGADNPTREILTHLENTYPDDYKWSKARELGMSEAAVLEELMYHKVDIQAHNNSDFYNGVSSSLVGIHILGADMLQATSEAIEKVTGWDAYDDDYYASFVQDQQQVVQHIRGAIEDPDAFFSAYTAGQISLDLMPVGNLLKAAKVGSKLYKARNLLETKKVLGLTYGLLGYAQARQTEDVSTSMAMGVVSGVGGVAVTSLFKGISNVFLKQGRIRAQQRFSSLNTQLSDDFLTTTTKKEAFEKFLVETAETTEDMALGTTISARLESPQFRSQALVQYLATTSDEGAILMHNSLAGSRGSVEALRRAKQGREDILLSLSKVGTLENDALSIMEKDWVLNRNKVKANYNSFIRSIGDIIPNDLSHTLPTRIVDMAVEELGTTTLSTTRRSLSKVKDDIVAGTVKADSKATARVDTLTRQLEKAKKNNASPEILAKLESKIQIANKDINSLQSNLQEGAMDSVLGALSDVSTILRKNLSSPLRAELTNVKHAIQKEVQTSLVQRLGKVKGGEVYKEFLDQRLAYAQMKNVETSKLGELLTRLSKPIQKGSSKKGVLSNEDKILGDLYKMELDDTILADLTSLVGSKGIERMNSLFIKSAVESGSIDSINKMYDMVIKKGATPEVKLFVDTIDKFKRLFADDITIHYGTTVDNVVGNRSDMKSQAASTMMKPIMLALAKHLPKKAINLISPLKQAALEGDIAVAFKQPAYVKAVIDELEHMTPPVRSQFFTSVLDNVPRLPAPAESVSFVGTTTGRTFNATKGTDLAGNFKLDKAFHKGDSISRSDKQLLKKNGVDTTVLDAHAEEVRQLVIQRGILDARDEILSREGATLMNDIPIMDYIRKLNTSEEFSKVVKTLTKDFKQRGIKVNSEEFNRMVKAQAKVVQRQLEKSLGSKVNDSRVTERALSMILGGK